MTSEFQLLSSLPKGQLTRSCLPLAKEKDSRYQAIVLGVGAWQGRGDLLGKWGHMASFKASDSEVIPCPHNH